MKFAPMRVEGGRCGALAEQKDMSHDFALGVALSVARFPMDVPTPDVKYLVFADGKPCSCPTCKALDAERLFNANLCRHCYRARRSKVKV